MKNIIQSIIIGISIAAIPGPIFFELVRRTLTKGFWNGALLSVGEFLGNFTLLILIFYGISSFLNYPVFQMLLYVLGGAILAWLGIIALKLKEENIDKSYTDAGKSSNSIFVGFTIAVSSPIVIALWFSLSGSYLAKFTSPFTAFLNIFFIAFGFIIFFFSLAAIIHYTRHKIPSKYVILLSKIFGLILLGYGGSFIYKFFTLLIKI
ncbi:MAG: LysE family transporter [bacterium]|nr:LysE family transporter [bacterium]